MIFEENRTVSNIEFIQIISMELYQFTYMQTYCLILNSALIIKMIIPKLNLYTSFLSTIPMTMTKLFIREIKKIESKSRSFAVICVCKMYMKIV